DYREKLIKLAEKLGIETEGKSEEQILDEILSKMEKERK
ncbi:twin-arginine translocase TatA/TatE family subunit, partial [Candidatus Bathyarchaeota archaeon ex4484_205]